MTAPQALPPYDALLLVSFGGPEGPDDVIPFLENVASGRDIPRARLETVAEHYYARGGVSPINAACRELVEALRGELESRDLDLPIYWGNRNWRPYLSEALAELSAHGHQRIVVITTSAYPSYSSCRQYLENLWDAAHPILEAGGSLSIDRIRHYAQHPGFVTANVDAVLGALDELGPGSDPEDRPRLVFVTHSIPEQMALTSGPEPRSAEGSYVDWHREVAAEVALQVEDRVGYELYWDLVYCSRSGSPGQPWLEPDVSDHLRTLPDQGVRRVVLVPIGFVADHMEVVNDLDAEALQTARSAGLQAVRAATVGTHPAFVRALIDLVVERATVARGELVLPRVTDGGSPGRYQCPPDCCPNLRERERPAACQANQGTDLRPAEGSARSGRVWTRTD